MSENKGMRGKLTAFITATVAILGFIATIVGLAADIPELLSGPEPYEGAEGENVDPQEVTVVVIASATAGPTVVPTATLTEVDTSTQDCDLDADVLAHTSVPDGSGVPAGAIFEKSWRIENTGTCTWNQRYTVEMENRLAGNLSVESVRFSADAVAPGDEVELIVTFVVAPGARVGANVRGGVQLLAPNGEAFGEDATIDINVTQGG